MGHRQGITSTCPIRYLVAAGILVVVGCSASPMAPSADGLNLREPDAAFMKRVERDPFPRAEQAPLKR